METTSRLGMNRTGLGTSPTHAKAMLEAADGAEVEGVGQGAASLAALRKSYIEEADPVGSVPPPATARGMLKSTAKMVTGKRPQALVDKLGERLAFERSGSRLYEALIAKHDADAVPSVPLERLRQFQLEEVQHHALLVDAARALGADPTVQTPCADVAGVESVGLLQSMTDPRTTFVQTLHGQLIAELVDNDGWSTLIAMAEREGHQELAARFAEALEREQEHLRQVREWYNELTLAEAKAGASLS